VLHFKITKLQHSSQTNLMLFVDAQKTSYKLRCAYSFANSIMNTKYPAFVLHEHF